MDAPWHEEHGFHDEVVDMPPRPASLRARWAICALHRRVALLTAREIQVLELMASGKSNREIADELVVVLDTVKKHVGHILDKPGATNRTQAIARAHVVGMVR